MPTAFISRALTAASPFRQLLKAANIAVVGQSLVEYSLVPFSAFPSTTWLFFYSKNGVSFFFKNLEQHATIAFNKFNFKWGAIGNGTAKALQQSKIQPDFIGNGNPAETASRFLEMVKGDSVLFVQAQHSRQSIQNLLGDHITAYNLIVYANQPRSNFDLPFCDFLVFTSPLNAQTYFKQYPWQTNQQVLAIGNTTATTLRQIGIKNCIIAKKPTEESLALAVLHNRFH